MAINNSAGAGAPRVIFYPREGHSIGLPVIQQTGAYDNPAIDPGILPLVLRGSDEAFSLLLYDYNWGAGETSRWYILYTRIANLENTMGVTI